MPSNCASCEKGIVNLLGQQAEYNAWKRLPFREPTERIARYGQGFSRILTMMSPDTEGPSHFSNHRNTVADTNQKDMYLSDGE